MAKDLRPVYTAVNADQAEAQLGVFAERGAPKYPAAVKMWRSVWAEFIPFLDYDVAIRRIICTTNAIVIWSRAEGVLDVHDELVRCRDLGAGRGYLQSSSTRVFGRFDVRSAGGGAVLAA